MTTAAEISTGPAKLAEPTGSVAPSATSGVAEPLLTTIRPASGWQLVNVRELWQYRELLYFLTWRDVKVRYKQTLLGAAWAVLQPALMMVVFTIFFGRMANVPTGHMPYPIFVFAGLLPWTFFATAIANAGNSVVGSEKLITKIYFPRLAVPLASVGAAIVDFLVACGLLVVLIVFYRVKGTPIHLTAGILMVPVIFALIILAATGVGSALAALNVNYRDFRYVIPFLVQIWLFATPTVYLQPSAQDSLKMQLALAANPMAALVASFRAAALGRPLPWHHLGLAALISVLVFLAGCLYFRKIEDSFADVI